jgi:Pseudouridylate synthase
LPKIDVKKANEILNLFVGTHDFIAFMKLGSDSKNTIRTITKAFCYSHKNKTIIVFKADGFLRSQIRLIVASLLKALTIENGDKLIYEALNLKSKENSKYDIKNGINLPQNKISKMTEKLANTTPLTRIPAPPNGLYLNRIFY